MSEEVRVYVTDLAAYNNGFLHGVWIDATLEYGIHTRTSKRDVKSHSPG